jgi:hypothetical protein
MFEAVYQAIANGGFSYRFSAPAGTSGSVSVVKPMACAGKAGVAVLAQQQAGAKSWGGCANRFISVAAGDGDVTVNALVGGDYTLNFQCGGYPGGWPKPGNYGPGHKYPSGFRFPGAWGFGGNWGHGMW